MKIKLFFLPFVLLSAPALLASKQDVKFSTCQKIKWLDLDAVPEEYRAVAQNMAENGLSTCDCITALLWAKESKKRDAITQELKDSAQELGMHWFSAATAPYWFWIVIDVMALALLDENKTETPVLQFDEKANLSIKEKQLIQKMFNKYSQYPITVTKNEKTYLAELVGTIDDKGKLDFSLELNSRFSSVDDDVKEGVLAHELQHIDHYVGHLAFKTALWRLDKKHDFKDFPEIMPASFSTDKYYAWIRCHEEQADRLPAAEGIAVDAKNMQKLFKFFTAQKNVRFTEGITHPALSKRLLWATRIAGLKQAEEQMANDGTFDLIRKKRAEQKEVKKLLKRPFHAMNLFS